ncbi:MAG: hypothetical protein EOS21_11935 [Mesorhizobium sp.]|nr:MAG: hypothetical protein EOS21_11935 [Mesorhizobium sp.]
MSRKAKLLALISAFHIWCWGHQALAAECGSQAEVDSLSRCKFFDFYRPNEASPDRRISNNLQLSIGEHARSIAVLVGIDSYPNLNKTTLSPAGRDIDHLTDFLKNKQLFDEIIVLRNESVTPENIRYFLRTYLYKRATLYGGKIRVLFAYSGHGIETHDGVPGALVLSAASGDTDIEHLLPLGELQSALKDLSRSAFHVLALINACYGGDIFGVGSIGSNESNTRERGGHVVTAGRNDQLVWSLGGEGDGSIFFDTLIKGITAPEARVWPLVRSSLNNELLQSGGVITLAETVGYLTSRFNDFIEKGVKNPATGQLYTVPWLGPVVPDGTHANGAFFFIAPVYNNYAGLTPKDTWQEPTGVDPSKVDKNSGNVVVNHPELSIFYPPGQYRYRGINVSAQNERVDWKRVRDAEVDYAIVRGSAGSEYKDPNYKENIEGASEVGIKAGALHTFSYCSSASEQMNNLGAVVTSGNHSLPIVLELPVPASAAERDCALRKPWQRRALKMTVAIKRAYKKDPIVSTSRYVVENVKLEREFSKLPIMLGDGRQQPSLNVGVKAPWTFWQFADRTVVDGVKGMVPASVFFGNAAQIEMLERGINVALLAVDGEKPKSASSSKKPSKKVASVKPSKKVASVKKSKAPKAVSKPTPKRLSTPPPTRVSGGSSGERSGSESGGGNGGGKGGESSSSR